MKSINPAEISVPELHSYLLGSIGPRPIALASTVDENGKRNLSPFSFLNIFSANPPIAVFSPARRCRDKTTKHTYENIKLVPEVCINVVNYDIVQQTSLSSTEYSKETDEFVKSGLTPLASLLIKPARVAESPVQMECRVKEVIELGTGGGAGNLIISEIVMIHINEDVLDSTGAIDQYKIDLVGRMGGNFYSRARSGLFEVEKPLTTHGIGVDKIPEEIRLSPILSGNDLGMLGNTESIPDMKDVAEYSNAFLKTLREGADEQDLRKLLHEAAKNALSDGKIDDAWKILLSEKL